jgi:hypothetical protein
MEHQPGEGPSEHELSDLTSAAEPTPVKPEKPVWRQAVNNALLGVAGGATLFAGGAESADARVKKGQSHAKINRPAAETVAEIVAVTIDPSPETQAGLEYALRHGLTVSQEPDSAGGRRIIIQGFFKEQPGTFTGLDSGQSALVSRTGTLKFLRVGKVGLMILNVDQGGRTKIWILTALDEDHSMFVLREDRSPNTPSSDAKPTHPKPR